MNISQDWRVDQLQPHPRHHIIYGNELIDDLLTKIRQSGWIKPLLVTPTGMIINGVRRWRVAQTLKLETVPVIVRDFASDADAIATLLADNRVARPEGTRLKTNEQKLREAQAWQEMVATQAKERQLAGVRAPTDLVVNYHKVNGKGRTRDILGELVGLSGRTVEMGLKVLDAIDHQPENRSKLRKQLEKSVSQAYRQLQNQPSTIAKAPEPPAKTYTEAELQAIITLAEAEIELRLIAQAREQGLAQAKAEIDAIQTANQQLKAENHQLLRQLEATTDELKELQADHKQALCRIQALEALLEQSSRPAWASYPFSPSNAGKPRQHLPRIKRHK